MKKMQFDIIECAAGWQAEATICHNWTCYSEVRKTQEAVRKDVEALAKLLNVQPVIHDLAADEEMAERLGSG